MLNFDNLEEEELFDVSTMMDSSLFGFSNEVFILIFSFIIILKNSESQDKFPKVKILETKLIEPRSRSTPHKRKRLEIVQRCIFYVIDQTPSFADNFTNRNNCIKIFEYFLDLFKFNEMESFYFLTAISNFDWKNLEKKEPTNSTDLLNLHMKDRTISQKIVILNLFCLAYCTKEDINSPYDFEGRQFLEKIREDYYGLYACVTEDFRKKARLPIEIIDFNKKLHSIILKAYKLFDYDYNLNKLIDEISKMRKRGCRKVRKEIDLLRKKIRKRI